MSKSVNRVTRAAAELGLDAQIVRMGESTRTAGDAARACGCTVGQIVKSLIFKGRSSGDLILLLVSGTNRVDPAKAAVAAGEPLDRADASKIRARTGFAIGGDRAAMGQARECFDRGFHQPVAGFIVDIGD